MCFMKRLQLTAIAVIGLVPNFASSVATAKVVVVVSMKSATTSLTSVQVSDIFLGKVSRFPDGLLAVPIDQADGSAARDEFYARVADKSPMQIRAYWSKIIFTGRGQPPLSVSNSIEVKKRIASDPRAIGYIEESLVDDSVRVLF
jgi:ABC-type phosphate transport system substrate-binding protein